MNRIEFTASRKDLKAGYDIVSKSVASKTSLPILGHILISRDRQGVLRMMATNLEQWTEYILPTDAQMLVDTEPGACTVPNKPFGSALSTLPDTAIELTGLAPADNQSLKTRLKAARAVFNLLGLDPEEFPVLPDVDTVSSMVFKAQDFKAAISMVHYAASTDETRVALTGMLLQYKEQYFIESCVRLVATDTHRLSVALLPFTSSSGAFAEYIIPIEAVRDAIRLVGPGDADTVTLTMDSKQMRIVFTHAKNGSQTTLITRLIDGQFPDVNRVIPETDSCPIRFNVQREQFIAALQRSFVVAQEQGSANRVVLTLGEQIMHISATSDTLGTIEDDLDISDPITEGIGMQMAANVRYLLNALQNMTADTLVVSLSAPLRPFRLDPVDNTKHIIILMPMQVV